ncbi:helix-turn-helix transcriptional regulator [Bacillus cereus]|uniref:Helix-turn-helix transcriptional regulator n=1 Tax=Bacillus cereus TaxID=1396 RepID=A0A2B0LWG3_BACCE|nr:helix-turn-helix transcriptional regulator [Bacillus cereus]
MSVKLSAKEKEVAILVSKGMKDKEIAQTLYISRRRVGEIIASIKEKWRIHHRVEIGIRAYYYGFITIEITPREESSKRAKQKSVVF